MSGSEPRIPFNRPRLAGTEQENIAEAVGNLYLSGNGPFSRRCSAFLEELLDCSRVLLTPSGTAALELSAMLLDLSEGDEVIMPSFTFPTSASSVARQGATPVFVDIREDTFNIDEEAVAAAIGPKTRAIMPVHYAGVGCQMDALGELAAEYDLGILEDAAHSIDASWRGQALGTFGALGALSFHETKNITCGEGGAVLINDPQLVERAEILQEKGTNRSAFFRGDVDKYTWVELGSSFVLSDLAAAFLWAQLDQIEAINAERMQIWERYMEGFASLEAEGLARRPVIPAEASHNAHLFSLLLEERISRDAVLTRSREDGVDAVFHYVPLHESPAGARLGRTEGSLERTESISRRLIRLPLWGGMSDEEIELVIETIGVAIRSARIGTANGATAPPRSGAASR